MTIEHIEFQTVAQLIAAWSGSGSGSWWDEAAAAQSVELERLMVEAVK